MGTRGDNVSAAAWRGRLFAGTNVSLADALRAAATRIRRIALHAAIIVVWTETRFLARGNDWEISKRWTRQKNQVRSVTR
jgi:hypothetical protein